MKRSVWMILVLVFTVMISACQVYEASTPSGPTGNTDSHSIPGEAPASTTCSHTYSEATCLQRAKCTKCGDVKGSLGAHEYDDGVCVLCGAEDPDWEPSVLTGSEYERINSLMEGMYQFRNSTGSLIEYQFEDGSFVCYAQIGDVIIDNAGTYELTEKTLVLYYQNGTVKECRWKLNNDGQIELFLLDLE